MNLSALGKRAPRVLYFVRGMEVTDAQREDAAQYGGNTAMRNALAVANTPHSALEECDFVAGDAPDRYRATYPHVDSAGSLEERLSRMSDYDLPHGLPADPNNEAARAAKPPSVAAVNDFAQGAERTPGAQSYAQGGFVAPTPQTTRAMPYGGPERAENARSEGVATKTNPFDLPAGGAVSTTEDRPVSGAVNVVSPAGSGFAPPPKEEKPSDGGDGLDKMSKDELKAEAERRGVHVESSATKAEIVSALRG